MGRSARRRAFVIAPLRRAHRFATLALAVAVPPAFALAIASRPALPPAGEIPAALAREPATGALVLERDDLWRPLAIRTRLFAGDAAGPVVEIAPLADLARPDVLVYWAADAAADRVPEGARWLGRLAGAAPRRFALPAEARARGGRLHLYSLGHAQWLGSAALEVP
ncbi:MAG: hypothetical protein DCC71_23990 [Proteobacteria bacterium]|nr:MAG: hypothetical protein DCC71_23990 [Pseudomonadota bacterium]